MLALLGAAACGTKVHVATEPVDDAGAAPGDPVAVSLTLGVDALRVAITNRSGAPVEVLWDRAVLVGTDGRASALVHVDNGGYGAEPNGAAARILPNVTLEAFVLPTRDVTYSPDAGWEIAPLLPVECGPMRCIGYHELVGKTVRLTLVVRDDGGEHAIERSLRITDAVRSVRGNRPTDPNLH